MLCHMKLSILVTWKAVQQSFTSSQSLEKGRHVEPSPHKNSSSEHLWFASIDGDGVVEDGSENNCPQCKFCVGCPSLSSHQWCPQWGAGNMTGLALAKDANESNKTRLLNVILYKESGADWSRPKHRTASRNTLLGFPNTFTESKRYKSCLVVTSHKRPRKCFPITCRWATDNLHPNATGLTFSLWEDNYVSWVGPTWASHVSWVGQICELVVGQPGLPDQAPLHCSLQRGTEHFFEPIQEKEKNV